MALEEIRDAGREARVSLDMQTLQGTFRDYDAARDAFDRLLHSMSNLFFGEWVALGTNALSFNS